MEALERVDPQLDERVGALLGHLLDLHAALRREHVERLLGAAVEREREVVLLRDVGGRLDPELADDVPPDVEPEDLLRALLRLVRVRGELDPARLAAPAGEDLGLDDDGAAEHLRRLARLAGGRREAPVGDRDPDAPEELLALIFVEIHAAREAIEEPLRHGSPCGPGGQPSCASMAWCSAPSPSWSRSAPCSSRRAAAPAARRRSFPSPPLPRRPSSRGWSARRRPGRASSSASVASP